jgi:hypothetical protein
MRSRLAEMAMIQIKAASRRSALRRTGAQTRHAVATIGDSGAVIAAVLDMLQL